MPTPTLAIRGGLIFDGLGSPPRRADVLVTEGRVTEVAEPGAPFPAHAQPIDATDAWVTPGFLDLHTHYDAEVELAPGLHESVRHGVTTIVLGSCGLSLAVGSAEDLADMFCRVEGIPRSTVLPLLRRTLDWSSPTEYLQHLQRLPLGPHVANLLGHSTIRAHAMGLGRSLDPTVRPTADELGHMERLVEEALDAGYLGLSINTLPWDKMDGEEFRSRPTPSVFGTWQEYRRLSSILRRRGRVFQGVPNLRTKLNIFLFLLHSTGIGRRPLKTTIIALIDAVASRPAAPIAGTLTRLFNRWLRADVRFQALPVPFELWTDGMEVPVLEEIAAGTEALHLHTDEARAKLLRDPDYRRRFKRQWASWIWGRAYHRNLQKTEIVEAPDPTLVGRSFGQVARERGVDAVDAYLDLVAEHGKRLRWYTVVGNDRPRVLERIMRHPDILIGFSDAGAHLRNMAYYNFPLRMLKRVRDAQLAQRPFMTIERAVQRLTSEIARWMGIEAGTLRPGDRADVVVVDPAGLDDSVEASVLAPMPGFDDLRRVVRRNDAAVRAVLINGRIAYEPARFADEFGQARGFGTLLRAQSS
ncbi:N-acyl-D-amino-acid deacylase family protein [Paraliomyxa miuraensis]|uniref:N-acyl-D-amino-acid deacylase family protein n=1 Tax=Paraliomyxa miuraensis TaxID=376150 RepID=UPI00225A896D|nr:amidohydrolase family protein [Paraliomyxa miuraensis]MCX4243490.1 amidohydrolase family protein [Paraliomyxa miuraensis]